MTSSSKKKKQRKAAFQKVKLKVGKRIPKGNVVDTTFKAKKIVIKDQLQSEAQQQNGRAKKDIKDFLSKLQHYNSTVRLDALKNLKESLTVYPELVANHLNSLVEKLSAIITDLHGGVRKLTTSLLKFIFSKIEPDHIVPFFPVIIAHLRCAMTHITHEIQSDSLSVVDLLVDYFPQHLRHFSQYLLQDFLNQISNQAKSFSNGVPAHKNISKRVLTHDPSRKVTSMSWYLKVCHRLKNILRNILENQYLVITKENDNPKLVRWESEKPLYVPLYGTHLCTNSELVNCVNNHTKDFFGDKAQFQAVASSLMPLLFEIWVEASSLNEDIAINQISNEPMQVYVCIVEIISLLWKIIEKWQREENDLHLEEWFVRNFGKSFISRCMTWFPYADRFKLDKKKDKEKTGAVESAIHLNLLLCDVVTCVASAMKFEENKYLNLAREYVMQVLSDGRQLFNFCNVDVILEILKKLLEKDAWQENQRLLEYVGIALKQLPPGSKYCKYFLNLLNIIIQQKKYSHLYNLQSLTSWVAQLPVNMLKFDIIPWQLLDVMRKAAPQRQPEFLENLKLNMSKILGKLSGLLVDSGAIVDAQKLIIDMLYWIPSIDTPLFTLIAKLCIDQEINANLSAYIIQVLNNRYKRCDPSLWCGGSLQYFSFLLSFTLGSSKVELTDLYSSTRSNNDSLVTIAYLAFERKPKITLDSKCSVLHQRNLTIIGIAAIQLISTDTYAQKLTEGFLIQLFREYQILPLRSACSVLLLVSRLWHVKAPPACLLPLLVTLTLSILEVTVTNDELYSVLLPAITEVTCLPGLSDSVCYQLKILASGHLTLDTVKVLGEVLLIIIKSRHYAHTEVPWSVLNILQVRHAELVEAAEWYEKAKYELHVQNRNS